MKAIYKYDGPLGTYALEEQNGLLTRLWLGDRMALLPGETEISETPLLKAAHRQLTAYFAEHYASDYPEPEAILAATLAGFRVGEAPVVMKERQGGVSSIRSFKSAYYMIKVSLSLIIDRLTIKKIHQPKSK